MLSESFEEYIFLFFGAKRNQTQSIKSVAFLKVKKWFIFAILKKPPSYRSNFEKVNLRKFTFFRALCMQRKKSHTY